MRLLDYLYLDTSKLTDYMSAVDPGVLRELRETVKIETADGATESFLNEPTGNSEGTKNESTHERFLTISERNSFTRLYSAIDDSIKKHDEDTEVDLTKVAKHDHGE